jgi:hypothetical protein
MQETDKIWVTFKCMRAIRSYSEASKYFLRMGTFVAPINETIEFTPDIEIDQNSISSGGKTSQGELVDLLPEWLAKNTTRVKKIQINFKSYDYCKLVFEYLAVRFDYPIEIYYKEFANWQLAGLKQDFVDHNIKYLTEWADNNDMNLEMKERNSKQSAVITITSKP